jgi:LacI family transcriptional regulator
MPPPARRPAIRDVAAEAGVSTMTVSRVVRGINGVAPETRDRVLRVIEKLNYRPSEIARILRQGQAEGLVGLIVTNLRNPFYSELALGVEDIIGESSLRLVLGNTGEDVRREEDLVADLASRRLQGMIVVPAGHRTNPHLRAIVSGGTPLVLVGRPAADVNADCVLVDDFGGALDVTASLAGKGHTRIAFLGNPPTVYTGAERYRGFSAALEDAGIIPDPEHVCRIQGTVANAEEAVKKLLDSVNPPTAIFCANNQLTMGAVRAILARGSHTVVAGFDNFELAELLRIPMIVAAYDAQDLGRRAAQLLIDQTSQPSSERIAPRSLVVTTEVIEYGT